jgi:hypothetical protein
MGPNVPERIRCKTRSIGVTMKRALASVLVLLLAACGGGGAGTSGSVAQPPGAQPPPPPPTQAGAFADTTGRVGLFQEFDRFMTPDQIQSDAPRYDAVWASSQPQQWASHHPGMVVSHYFIPQEDRSILSQHGLDWWQANHPDWILYACDANDTPTHDFAYWAGVDRADVPLDFHNPDVIDYQVRQLNGANAIASGANSLSIDQVVFQNAMVGGNPNFGQTVKSGEYACGVWKNGTFVRRYSGVNDPAWTADMVAFVKAARQIVNTDPTLAPHHLKILINHPLTSPTNATEQALFDSVDAIINERGYSDYARYQTPADANVFRPTTDYLLYAQSRGIAVFTINYFNTTEVSPQQREYIVAAYFMANQGREYLFITPTTTGAGYEHNYPEYEAKLGTPCGAYYGGPYIYYRKFSNGLVVLNSGSLPAASQRANLPSNHAYTDVDGRKVTNPLNVASNDGYVLLTTNGCS